MTLKARTHTLFLLVLVLMVGGWMFTLMGAFHAPGGWKLLVLSAVGLMGFNFSRFVVERRLGAPIPYSWNDQPPFWRTFALIGFACIWAPPLVAVLIAPRPWHDLGLMGYGALWVELPVLSAARSCRRKLREQRSAPSVDA
jgi:hypothetical protein